MYTVLIKLSGQEWRDISHLVRDTVVIQQFSCNNNFKNTQNTATLELIQDDELYTGILQSNDNIFVRILREESILFAGYIPPSATYVTDGLISSLKFEVLDNCGLLQKNIETEIIIENLSLYSGIHDSVCKRLLAQAGFDETALNPGVFIADTVRALAVSVDDNLTYYDLFNQLFFEYGYTLRFDNAGQLTPYQWIRNAFVPTAFFDEHNILGEMTAQKDIFATKSVAVTWYSVGERSNTSIYVADIPLADNGTIIGYTLKPGMLYPVEANVGTAYLEYVSDNIVHNLTKDSPYANAKADLSDLIITKNHRLDWRAGSGATLEKALYLNKKAEIIIKNTSVYDRMLYGLDIYADVVWRSARRETSADTGLPDGETENIDTLYISAEDSAKMLCSAIASYRAYSRYVYTISSEAEASAGDIVLLTAGGIAQICYIASVTVDMAYQHSAGIVYQYQLRGITSPVIDIKTESAVQGSNIYNKIYQDLANGTVAIGGVPGTILSDMVPPAGGEMLTVVPLVNGNVRLTWSEFFDNVGGSGMAGYNIYRRTDADPSPQRLGGTNADTLIYIDTTANLDTGYYYGVSAYDRNNNESGISWRDSPVIPRNIVPVDAPAALKAKALRNRIELTWTAPADASLITYYEIWINDAGTWRVLALSGTPSYNHVIGNLERAELSGWLYNVRAYNIHETYSNFAAANGVAVTDFTQYGTFIKAILTPQLSASINTVTVAWLKQFELMNFKAVNIEYRRGPAGTATALQVTTFATVTNLQYNMDAANMPISTEYQFRLQQVDDLGGLGAWSEWIPITIHPADYTVLRADKLEASETNFTHIQAGWVIGYPQDAAIPAEEKFKMPDGTAVSNTSYIDFRTGRFRLGDRLAYIYGNFDGVAADSFIRFTSLQLNLTSSDLITNAGGVYLKHGGNALSWGTQQESAGYGSISAASDALRINGGGASIIDMSGTIIVNSKNGNFSEGIRINHHANGWATLMLGASPGSLNGHDGTGWFFGRTPAGNLMVNPINALSGNGLDMYRGGDIYWRNKLMILQDGVISDANSAFKSGWSQLDPNSINIPVAGHYFSVRTDGGFSDAIYQTANHTWSSSVYRRRYDGSVWSDWVLVRNDTGEYFSKSVGIKTMPDSAYALKVSGQSSFESPGGDGITVKSAYGVGIRSTGSITGVYGICDNNYGVYGGGNIGVYGNGISAGVSAYSTNGIGIRAESYNYIPLIMKTTTFVPSASQNNNNATYQGAFTIYNNEVLFYVNGRWYAIQGIART